jgi:hypothetical protein
MHQVIELERKSNQRKKIEILLIILVIKIS